jgi:DNA-binding Xre family transcriptional regulator
MTSWAMSAYMAESLERQLASFLRKRRGDLSYAKFSRKIGLPSSTLHRLEMCEQSITLRRLQQITKRLKCSVRDIFRAG